MLCDECQMNEAIYTVSFTDSEGSTSRHLCGECLKKMEKSVLHMDFHSFINPILSILSATKTDDGPVCSGCGLRYSTFEKTGKLGCAKCYHDFEAELTPMLKRIHGNSQHNGRTPANMPQADAASSDEANKETLNNEENQKKLLALKELSLKEQMEAAIATENFEEAARIRDELRLLKQTGEVSPDA